MNLFRWVCATRLRLAIFCLLGLALWVGLAIPMADYIRRASSSTTVDLLLMTGVAFVILGSATFLAVLIGDRLFPGRWRERVILGRVVEPDNPDDDAFETVNAMKSYYLHFSLILVVLLVASGMLLESMTGGFFGEYSRYGRFRWTVLRSDDTTRKLDELSELAELRRQSFAKDALKTLDIAWRDDRQPEVVRTAALHSLGQLAIYLADAVDVWVKEGRQESWQLLELRRLRDTVAPDLRRAFPSAPTALQTEIVFTLGGLRDRGSLPMLREALAAHPDPADPIWRAAVIGVGRLKQDDALADLAGLVETDMSDDAFRALTWSTRQLLIVYHKNTGELPPDLHPKEITALLGTLAERYGAIVQSGATERRCLAALVLEATAFEDIREPLIKAFDAPGAEVTCEAIGVNTGAKTPGWMGEVDPLRERIINAIALVSLSDREVETWAKARLAKGDLDEYMTTLMTDLVNQIESRRP